MRRILNRKVFGVGFVASMLSVAMAVPSFATYDYTNTFSGVGTELTAALTAIVPLVVVVFALLLGIRLAFKLFKRVTSAG
jgi:hypothetical protein